MYNYVKELNKDGYFTVNFSIYAKEFYEKLGFVCISDEQSLRGLRFYPMKKDFK